MQLHLACACACVRFLKFSCFYLTFYIEHPPDHPPATWEGPNGATAGVGQFWILVGSRSVVALSFDGLFDLTLLALRLGTQRAARGDKGRGGIVIGSIRPIKIT